MFFKRKFFLDLSGDDSGKPVEPAKIAPVVAAPEAKPGAAVKTAAASTADSARAAVQPTAAAATAAAEPAPAPATSLTTAEAIAAELAEAQANRPAPTLSSFAPECLVPGAATPVRRRRGGANLAGFREIARSYLKS